MSVEELNRIIRAMHDGGYWHSKRKYQLNTVPPQVAILHEAEEVNELLGATIAYDFGKLKDKELSQRELQLEECADRLACALHSHMTLGFTLEEVVNRAVDKMEQVFISPEEWEG